MLTARPRGIVNSYCDDPEDRVIPTSCPCCTRCWLFVQARQVPVVRDGKITGYKSKVGTCVFGGPHGGWDRENAANHSESPKA